MRRLYKENPDIHPNYRSASDDHSDTSGTNSMFLWKVNV